jgi:DNA transposition AAA+ family ATPase
MLITQHRPTCPEPEHLSGVTGAATLETPGLREIRGSVKQLLDSGGLILIDGAVGVGKTFATRSVLRETESPVYWTDMTSTPKGKETTAKVFTAITGRRPTRNMTEHELTDETVDALNGLEAVLVIDEAQNMTANSLRALRYLHDRPSTCLLLILVGPGVMEAVRRVPEVDSRVSRRAIIQALRGKNGIALLREWHPVFANTDEAVLISLAEYARGNLRSWAHILEQCCNTGVDPSEGINSIQANFFIRSLTGGRS